MAQWRVLLADDHLPSIRRWRSLLEPEFDIVGTVLDGRALVEAIDRLVPDVAVADIALPRLSGIAAAAEVMPRRPGVRIVFVTVHADQMLLRQAISVGAFGYVLKARAGHDLVPAVRAALRGELLISPFPVPEGTVDEL